MADSNSNDHPSSHLSQSRTQSSNRPRVLILPPQEEAGRSSTTVSPASSGRHPIYRGIRCRSGKWVSEIREPRKTTRIWLGTYPTPEMAAAAYDAAAFALKGSDATLNFPNSVFSYNLPASPSAADIRAAAATAAASRAPNSSTSEPPPVLSSPPTTSELAPATEYIDEEEFFDMPNLLADMAEGMLISPPRTKSNDSPETSQEDNLWSYPRH